MKRANNIKPLRSMIGMSLVEILAAMLIGLIGMTIIMQVFALSESRKRTTGGTSDAQITGNIAMFTLERELRNAGYGMITTESNMLGCTTVAYDSTRNIPDFTINQMAPVAIVDGGGGAPDQMTIIYGDAPQSIDGAEFSSSANPVDNFPLSNAAGIRLGAIAVASDPGGGVNCAMVEVTGFAVGAVNNVMHVSGASYTYTNNFGFPVTVTATRNKPGGVNVGGAFTNNARLFSLGRSPTVITYLVNNGGLESRTLVPYNAAQDANNDDLSEAEVADGVVQFQAQYGKDTDADRIVDTWDQTTPATAAGWLEVQAVRFGVLVRSSQFERTAVTTVAPTWYAGAYTMTDVDGTPDSNPGDANDWRHYRYRNYQTVVPLRNMIWSTEP
ncbi:MAG: PilW family protein [Betaproteobacteria bacterium]|nr:MAG: PilW family protein [Betaproteobacteria bacterium]